MAIKKSDMLTERIRNDTHALLSAMGRTTPATTVKGFSFDALTCPYVNNIVFSLIHN